MTLVIAILLIQGFNLSTIWYFVSFLVWLAHLYWVYDTRKKEESE